MHWYKPLSCVCMLTSVRSLTVLKCIQNHFTKTKKKSVWFSKFRGFYAASSGLMAVGCTRIWFHLGWFQFQSLPPSCLIITPTDFLKSIQALRRHLINNWQQWWLKHFNCGLSWMFGVHTIFYNCFEWLRTATTWTQHAMFPFLQQSASSSFLISIRCSVSGSRPAFKCYLQIQ